MAELYPRWCVRIVARAQPGRAAGRPAAGRRPPPRGRGHVRRQAPYLVLLARGGRRTRRTARAGHRKQPMSERRYDPTSGEWVTFATHRQERTFLPPADSCPLCPDPEGAWDGEIR